MACVNSLSSMRPVTNFSSCEHTVSPIAVSYTCQQVLPSGNSERGLLRDGCLSCRWRKKKCKPTEAAITPSPIYPCIDCAKFNIRCDGCGVDRPTGSDRAKAVRHALKGWIANKDNREGCEPLDLTPFYKPAPPSHAEPIVVDPSTITTSRVIRQENPQKHVRDPMIERDPTRSRTEDHPSQGVVNNGQTQSNSLYLYPETHDYIGIPLAGFHNNSLAWYDVDGSSPQVPNGYDFEYSNVGTCPQSSGSSSEEYHTLEFLLDSFLAVPHNMPHLPSNDGAHSHGNR